MRRKVLATAVATACVGGLLASGAVHSDGFRAFFFFPIDGSANTADWDPTAPWKIPFGYQQELVSGEADLNVYPHGVDDLNDMNTVNETGPQAGRFLYRTHEVGSNGAVSVVDLETGAAKVLAQDSGWRRLDGILWTPWGTILFAEETTGGRLFEIFLDPNDRTQVQQVLDREAVGRLAHEGIEVGPDGEVYVIDEFRGRSEADPNDGNTCGGNLPCGGGIYKFVPAVAGNLATGNLYALKVTGPDGTGQGEWVGPIVAADARAGGSTFGGESYERPEDVEIIGATLYVAITEGSKDVDGELYDGRVLAIDLETLVVSDFVKGGVNVPVEIGSQTGFDNVDNLAKSPDGRLVMVEDNVPSDIWFASTWTNEFGAARTVDLFASLSDPGAEGTGIYFDPKDPETLYVNVQHSAAPDGDGTWAIRRKRPSGW
jgi:secreted PhoX family phosphatase